MCISTGITFDEFCEVVLGVKEEEKYPRTLDMGQCHIFVLELKDEMTWSHEGKPERTLAYLDKCVADREGKFFMTQEDTILSQRGDQYQNEFFVAGFTTEDKEEFSNFRKYDEELKMLEDWLNNPRIDKDDCLMFDFSIVKEQIEGQNTKLFYNLVDSSRK